MLLVNGLMDCELGVIASYFTLRIAPRRRTLFKNSFRFWKLKLSSPYRIHILDDKCPRISAHARSISLVPRFLCVCRKPGYEATFPRGPGGLSLETREGSADAPNSAMKDGGAREGLGSIICCASYHEGRPHVFLVSGPPEGPPATAVSPLVLQALPGGPRPHS